MSDPGFTKWMPDTTNDWGFSKWSPDTTNDRGFSSGGLLGGLPDESSTSSLHLLLEPEDIATIPGLPQHVYDNAARHAQSRPAAANSGAGVYASRLDQISLAPQDLNPSGLGSSASGGQSADVPSKPGDKYEQGAKAAEYFGNAIDWWNDQNKILGMHLGQAGPDMLEKYTGPIGKGLVATKNSLEAAGEIANGAPKVPTLAGAGIKTGGELGGAALGSLVGGILLTPAGLTPVGAVGGGILGGLLADRALEGKSNQQVGEAAGQSLYNGMVGNAYYDPRLIAMP